MKKFLSTAAVTLLTSAFLDPLIKSGLDKPIPWLMDLGMALGGVACLYILVKYHGQL